MIARGYELPYFLVTAAQTPLVFQLHLDNILGQLFAWEIMLRIY